jgi:hypothetical protein
MYELRNRFSTYRSVGPFLKTSRGTIIFQIFKPHTQVDHYIRRQRRIYKLLDCSNMWQIIIGKWNKPKLSCQYSNYCVKGMKQKIGARK